jgi:hypothetical protein
MLAQQLEMIHTQTVAVFNSTGDWERRIQICREAVAALEALSTRYGETKKGR